MKHCSFRANSFLLLLVAIPNIRWHFSVWAEFSSSRRMKMRICEAVGPLYVPNSVKFGELCVYSAQRAWMNRFLTTPSSCQLHFCAYVHSEPPQSSLNEKVSWGALAITPPPQHAHTQQCTHRSRQTSENSLERHPAPPVIFCIQGEDAQQLMHNAQQATLTAWNAARADVLHSLKGCTIVASQRSKNKTNNSLVMMTHNSHTSVLKWSSGECKRTHAKRRQCGEQDWQSRSRTPVFAWSTSPTVI